MKDQSPRKSSSDSSQILAPEKYTVVNCSCNAMV